MNEFDVPADQSKMDDKQSNVKQSFVGLEGLVEMYELILSVDEWRATADFGRFEIRR